MLLDKKKIYVIKFQSSGTGNCNPLMPVPGTYITKYITVQYYMLFCVRNNFIEIDIIIVSLF